MTIICYKVVLHQFHVGGIRRFHKCHKYGKNNLTLFNETLMPVYKHTNLKGKGWKLITQSVLGWSPSSFLSTLKTQKQNRFRCCDMFGHKKMYIILFVSSHATNRYLRFAQTVHLPIQINLNNDPTQKTNVYHLQIKKESIEYMIL